MSESISGTLDRAYDLIESGNREEARSLLQPLLETHADNPDLWWLYTHAVEDPEEGRAALARVNELDPAYPGAATLSEASGTPVAPPAASSASGLKSLKSLKKSGATAPPPPPDLPVEPPITDMEPDLDEDLDFEDDLATGPSRRRSPLLLVAALVLILILVGAGLVFSGVLSPEAEATPTQVAAVATDTASPTDAPTTNITDPTATAVTTADAASAEESIPALALALTDFDLDGEGVSIVQSDLGETVAVSVCTVPGQPFSETLGAIFDAIEDEADALADSTEAVGVTVVNCGDEDGATPLVGVTADDLRALAAGDLSERDFQARLRPLG